MRLGLFDTDYTTVARRAYKGFVEQFMVSDGKGGVHLIGCSKSAGLGGSNYRDGSAAYYLMGKDTEPTVANPSSSSFYTEGKVLGGFILAATEYERRFIDGGDTGLTLSPPHPLTSSPSHPLTSSPSHPLTLYNLASMRLTTQPRHGIFIKNNKKYVLNW